MTLVKCDCCQGLIDDTEVTMFERGNDLLCTNCYIISEMDSASGYMTEEEKFRMDELTQEEGFGLTEALLTIIKERK